MDSKSIAGPVKAAILIRALGRPHADTLLSQLSDTEKERIHSHLSQIRTISPEVVEQVAAEFAAIASKYRSKPGASSGSDSQLKAADAPVQSQASGLEALKSLNADDIYDLIKDEQPQTIAIILVQLETNVASDVIAKLPDKIKIEVAMRVIHLDKVTAAVVDEVNSVLKDILKSKQSSVSNVTGGVDRLAEILNQTDEISS
ncbi:MAG: hypothetical protein PVI58_17310, partial [Desulfobacterales bacterium]